ncbi:hypothetical protein EPUS_04988 [Endocarpon pusillum Z07020]|uniref:Fungal N-terminal domain-containing protein n=1 Tax=Endocarpon pusillum (strain Z07020 / HMAS-L-300199) TaxID=1263415 RepID=U1HNW4_ENDPU|nr:uncharacterized protein EPUS_04988 [Endocarpon pusillum Z07020]ERF72070.1 hypothetical protein EPUS_04988 [Endocarpon pusillum Z07020]
MDPLSVTVSVSSLLVIAARVVKVIHDIRGDYKDAEFILCSIASECTVTEAFDTALLGCALTLSVLDEELRKLVQGGFIDTNALEPRKLKYLVENERLKELLQQIRGQLLAITLLLNTYQTESISDLKKAVQENHNILKQIASRARSLWQESQHGDPAQRPPEVVCGEQDSVFELSSIITDTRFDFDDEILDSRAYRRALTNIYWSTSGVSSSKRHAAVANACLVLPEEEASLTTGEVSEYRKRADLEKLGERSEHVITATKGTDNVGKSALREEPKTARSWDQDKGSTRTIQEITGSNAENTTAPTTLSEHSATYPQDGEIVAQEDDEDNGDAKPKGLSHTTSREEIGNSHHVKPTVSVMDLLQAACKTWEVTKHSRLSTWDAPGEARHLMNEVSSLQKVFSILQDNTNIREATIPRVLRADCGTTMVFLHSTVLNILAQLNLVDSDGLRTFWESSQGTFERATMSDLQNELAVHRRRFQQYLNDSREPPYSPTHTNKASQLPTLNKRDCEPQTSVIRPDQRESNPVNFENP